MERLQPLIGLALIAAIAVAWSSNRRAINLRTVAWGFGLQLLFAVLVLKTGAGQTTFQFLGDRIRQLLEFSAVGSALVFGPLGDRADRVVHVRAATGQLGEEDVSAPQEHARVPQITARPQVALGHLAGRLLLELQHLLQLGRLRRLAAAQVAIAGSG